MQYRKFEEIVVEYPSPDLCTYPEYKGKPYFGIKYLENENHIIGYGTYNPKVLSDFLEKYFIPRWIPVSEKLPEEKTAILLSCDDMYLAKLNPCIGWINGNNWHTFSARGSYLVKYPIAWMPLPEPYKAESEG